MSRKSSQENLRPTENVCIEVLQIASVIGLKEHHLQMAPIIDLYIFCMMLHKSGTRKSKLGF
jgi:hypothetical protein